MSKRVIISGGGTGGHIFPAIAIANAVKGRWPDADILFVGANGRMEMKRVPEAGYPIQGIDSYSLRRDLSIKGILENLKLPFRMWNEKRAACRILQEFRPDIAIGVGGYVSWPVLDAAAGMGIPTLIQEQNSFPGVTTKMLARRADLIFVPNSDAMERIGKPKKTVIAGNPVNAETGRYDRQKAREELGVGERRCIVSFGGSLGAVSINSVVREMLARAGESGEYFFVHATGSGREEKFFAGLAERGVYLDRIPCRISTYINDMPRCLAAADMVVCRAGATTIAELEAAGRASYLIPFPQATENHQYFNAKTLADAGAALLEAEKDLEPGRTAERILEAAGDRQRTEEMGRAAKALGKTDTASVIYDRIKELIG